jgi:hypothetical protein
MHHFSCYGFCTLLFGHPTNRAANVNLQKGSKCSRLSTFCAFVSSLAHDGWMTCWRTASCFPFTTGHKKHIFMDFVRTYRQRSEIETQRVCQPLTCTVCQQRLQVCTSTNRWHWGHHLSTFQKEIDSESCSRLCSGVLRNVLMPCACRYSLLWKKRVEIHNKVFKMKSAVAIIMVFVGCCSNVVFLELLVK